MEVELRCLSRRTCSEAALGACALRAPLGVCKVKNAKKQGFFAFFLSEMHFGKQSATNC